MNFLLLEVRSPSTGTQRSKPYGQDCMRLRFREAVNKTRIGFTWFWDYAAEPRSHRIWMRGYKNLSRLRSSLLHYNYSVHFSSKTFRYYSDVRCVFFQKL
jgi:hypothetical protein